MEPVYLSSPFILLLTALGYTAVSYILITSACVFLPMMLRSNSTQIPHVYMRSSLARALYARIENENSLADIDRSQWYRFATDEMDGELASHFVQLSEDAATDEFYDKCENNQNPFLQMLQTVTKPLFSLFITQTSVNGLLNRGSMFVISTEHLRRLLPDVEVRFEKLLDLGAGDGGVTDQLAPLANQVYVTELSPVMRWRLARKGYQVVGVDEWQDRSYDFISCLNLLDRCDLPLSLLSQIKHHLAPHGLLLVAIVLPYQPYVESRSSWRPCEALAVDGDSLEGQVSALYHQVLSPAGFQLVSFSRVPYLCEGDFYQTFYYLTDVIMLLRHNESS